MKAVIGPHTVEVVTELLNVDVMSAPDPGWRFTDAAGHEHKWVLDATSFEDKLPTCEQFTVRAGFGSPDEDWYEPPAWIWRCRQCKETIYPGTRPERAIMAGPTTIYIDGEEATKELVEQLILQYKQP